MSVGNEFILTDRYGDVIRVNTFNGGEAVIGCEKTSDGMVDAAVHLDRSQVSQLIMKPLGGFLDG